MKIDSMKLLAIAILASFGWTVMSAFGQQEYTGMVMNASLLQPISISISGNLTNGVFFTNGTQIGIQYPIAVMTVLNNATANYWNTSSGSSYYVMSALANTINISAYHCACDDLTCEAGGSCAAGTDKMYVSYTADGGVAWANGTASNFAVHAPPDTTNYYFPGIDSYQVLGVVDNGRVLYLRYWNNPRPNNAPSGNYTTTFKVRAVETGISAGTCSC